MYVSKPKHVHKEKKHTAHEKKKQEEKITTSKKVYKQKDGSKD